MRATTAAQKQARPIELHAVGFREDEGMHLTYEYQSSRIERNASRYALHVPSIVGAPHRLEVHVLLRMGGRSVQRLCEQSESI